jgi:hypothetical protein
MGGFEVFGGEGLEEWSGGSARREVAKPSHSSQHVNRRIIFLAPNSMNLLLTTSSLLSTAQTMPLLD